MAETRRRWLERINVPGILLIIVLILLWQALDAGGVLQFEYLSSPMEIAQSLSNLMRTSEFWSSLGHTVTAVAAAWGSAFAIGVVLGVLIGIVPGGWRWSMASIDVLRTLPAVALVPVALLVFGFSMRTEIVVAAMVAVWPVVVIVAVAIQGAHPRLYDVAHTFQLSKLAILRKLLIPSAWPEIVVAARLALSISLILVVVTEMVGNPQGLGFAIISAQNALQPAAMWTNLIVIAIVGVILQSALNTTAKALMPGLAPRLKTGATA